MSTSDLILDFANTRSRFTLSELASFVRGREVISDSGILWHIKKLIGQNYISRLSRGVYGRVEKSEFCPTLSNRLINVYSDVTAAFPLIDVTVLSGNDISSLQHHISANNAIYVEVPKDATEAVFHYLSDRKKRVYHNPTANFMSDYVDLSEKSIIVKTLTTESPIRTINGIRTPALEKILVDINIGSDFYYLQGDEAFYIMRNAMSLYSINIPRMLRYASRRGVKETMQTILNYQE